MAGPGLWGRLSESSIIRGAAGRSDTGVKDEKGRWVELVMARASIASNGHATRAINLRSGFLISFRHWLVPLPAPVKHHTIM